MSRKVGVGEFGVPKPLVGQAGYKLVNIINDLNIFFLLFNIFINNIF